MDETRQCEGSCPETARLALAERMDRSSQRVLRAECSRQADAKVSRRVGRPVDRRWPARTDTGDCLGAVAQSARSS